MVAEQDGRHPSCLAECRDAEPTSPVGRRVGGHSRVRPHPPERGPAVTQTRAGLTAGASVMAASPATPGEAGEHATEEIIIIIIINPSGADAAESPLSKRHSKASGQGQGSQPRKGLGHSLGGHGLLLEGDEGHPQGLVLDPALLLCDPPHELVLHASVVRDGVLLPEDTPPGDVEGCAGGREDPHSQPGRDGHSPAHSPAPRSSRTGHRAWG